MKLNNPSRPHEFGRCNQEELKIVNIRTIKISNRNRGSFNAIITRLKPTPLPYE